MKTTTVNKKAAPKKTAPKKAAAKKAKPKPGSWAAVLKSMEYAEKHPIKFIWE